MFSQAVVCFIDPDRDWRTSSVCLSPNLRRSYLLIAGQVFPRVDEVERIPIKCDCEAWQFFGKRKP